MKIILCTHHQVGAAMRCVPEADWDNEVYFLAMRELQSLPSTVEGIMKWMSHVSQGKVVTDVFMTAVVNRMFHREAELDSAFDVKQLWHHAVDLTPDHQSIQVMTFNTILDRLGYEP